MPSFFSDSGRLFFEASVTRLLECSFSQKAGTPSPDFGGGIGESEHVGRWGPAEVAIVSEAEGMRAFGLEAFNSEAILSPGQQKVMDRANRILGFYD